MLFGASIRKSLTRIPIQYPFAFGVCISTVKTSFSDFLVQKVVEKREKIDWKRNAAFAAFGCVYLGGFQYVLFVPFFGRVFPKAASFAAKPLRDKLKDTKGMLTVCAQVFIDQFIHHPLLYFPAFYLTKEFVMSDKPDVNKTMAIYKHNMKDDLLALWKIWIPSGIINFSFMPMWGRIPWVAATSFIWTCVLSSMRGGDVVHAPDMAMGSVSGASMTLMEEGIEEMIYSSPVELDKHLAHFCISAAGPDRVGWVSTLASAVAEKDGNITHSKMIRFGQDFIVLMHVAVPPEKLGNLVSYLKKSDELKPLNIQTSFLTKRQTILDKKPKMGIRIHCVGEDRPGMLAAIANKVNEEKLSVENITTELKMGKNGKRDFVINCDCTSTRRSTPDELELLTQDFTEVKDAMNFDILDVRVHTSNE